MKAKLYLKPSAVLYFAAMYLAAGESFWALAAAIAVHELGHFAALRAVGAEIETISVGWTGLQLRYRRTLTHLQDALCAAAGPAAGLVFAVLCLNCGGELHESGRFSAALTAFNLLPAGPLDGAGVLRGLIEARFSPYKVDAVMTVSTCSAALLLLLAPVWLRLPLQYAVMPAFAGAMLLFSVAKTRRQV